MVNSPQTVRISLDGWEPGTSLLDFLVLKNDAFVKLYSGGLEGNYIEFKNMYCKRGHKLSGDNLRIRTSGNGGPRECKKCCQIRNKARREKG